MNFESLHIQVLSGLLGLSVVILAAVLAEKYL